MKGMYKNKERNIIYTYVAFVTFYISVGNDKSLVFLKIIFLSHKISHKIINTI